MTYFVDKRAEIGHIGDMKEVLCKLHKFLIRPTFFRVRILEGMYLDALFRVQGEVPAL